MSEAEREVIRGVGKLLSYWRDSDPKGYSPPGSADPHGYLVSVATAKVDDAIRAMNHDAAKLVQLEVAKATARLEKIYGAQIDELLARVYKLEQTAAERRGRSNSSYPGRRRSGWPRATANQAHC